MKKLSKSIMAMFFAISLVSCAVGPTAKLADGSLLTLGGSLMTEASADARSLTMPNGMAMNWVRGNVNETAVAKTAIMGATAVGIAAETTKTVISNNGVKNVAAKEATKQVGIKSAAEVDKAALIQTGGPAGSTTPSGLVTTPIVE